MLGKRYAFNLNHVVAASLAVMVFAMAYKGINIDYKVENNNIIINWFSGVVIPVDDVVEVSILEETPKMEKVFGIDLFSIRQGTYSLEGIGRVKVYSKDIKRKMVLIKTHKMSYGLTPEDAREFARLINDYR